MTCTFTVTYTVSDDMIDHNQHMHDANYNSVFSTAINQFNYTHGLSLAERETLNFSIFTAEEQTSYLSELKLHDTFTIHLYLYDFDAKRVHFFAMLIKDDGSVAATNEAMMLGIDRATKKVSPFPDSYYNQLTLYKQQQATIDWPKQLGHQIGIPK